MPKSKIITYTLAVIITVGIGATLSIAANWTPPAGSPPGNNVEAPINVGSTPQTKNGPLTIKGLIETTIDGIKFPDGTIQTTASAPASLPVGDAPACDFDGTWGYHDEGGGNDFGLSCKDGKVIGWCGGSNWWWFGRGFTAGRYGCLPWVEVLTAHKPGQYFSGWPSEEVATFTAPSDISAIRVRGHSDEGGYCYASWGTGHVETYRGNPSTGYYNLDNNYYDGTPIYDDSKLRMTPAGTDADGYPVYNYSCTTGTVVFPTYTDGEGFQYTGAATCQVGTNSCPANPPVFTNNGVAKICQPAWSYGGLVQKEKYGVNIPAGTEISLRSNFVNKNGLGGVSCFMDVYYK